MPDATKTERKLNGRLHHISPRSGRLSLTRIVRGVTRNVALIRAVPSSTSDESRDGLLKHMRFERLPQHDICASARREVQEARSYGDHHSGGYGDDLDRRTPTPQLADHQQAVHPG